LQGRFGNKPIDDQTGTFNFLARLQR